MYKDRLEAGEKLADKLKAELSPESLNEAIILAVPRGGVLIGDKLREILRLPLDLLIIKKIPAPNQEELVIGAVADGGTVVWEEELANRLKIPLEYQQEVVKDKVNELEKKENELRILTGPLEVKDKTVIICDDLILTGATIKAALAVIKSLFPKEIIVSVPVISLDCLEEIKQKADRVVCLETPPGLFNLKQFYQVADEPSDEEVRAVLKK